MDKTLISLLFPSNNWVRIYVRKKRKKLWCPGEHNANLGAPWGGGGGGMGLIF